MKLKEIKELTKPELEARKRELRQESFHLRLQRQSGQLEKTSQIRSIRREVAQVETVLTQRNQEAAAATTKKA
jgi:large subunit ribosomal protein L29